MDKRKTRVRSVDFGLEESKKIHALQVGSWFISHLPSSIKCVTLPGEVRTKSISHMATTPKKPSGNAPDGQANINSNMGETNSTMCGPVERKKTQLTSGSMCISKGIVEG